MEDVDQFAEASHTPYSTVTEAPINLGGLAPAVRGAHFISGQAPSHEITHLTLSVRAHLCLSWLISRGRPILLRLHFERVSINGGTVAKQMACSKISLTASA